MTGSERPDRPERPPPTASEAEMAEWRAEDFGWALLAGPDEDEDGIRKASDE